MGKRVYEQKTYLESTGRGFWGNVFNILKWLVIIGIAIVILGAIF